MTIKTLIRDVYLYSVFTHMTVEDMTICDGQSGVYLGAA